MEKNQGRLWHLGEGQPGRGKQPSHRLDPPSPKEIEWSSGQGSGPHKAGGTACWGGRPGEGRERRGKGRGALSRRRRKPGRTLAPLGHREETGRSRSRRRIRGRLRVACVLFNPIRKWGTRSPRTPACNPSWGGVGLPGAAGQRQGWRPLNTDGAPPRARLSRGPHRVSEPAGTPPEEHPGCSLSGGGTPLNGLLCSSPSLTGLPPQPILQMRKSRFRIVKSEGPQRKPLFLASGPTLGTQ